MLQLQSPTEVARQLADRLRCERLRRGWTQHTLAERAGVSLPMLRRYERTAQATIASLLKLLSALGRLDECSRLLAAPTATSIEELESRAAAAQRLPKRGTR